MTGSTGRGSTTHKTRQFRLPDVGEGLTQADIIRWHVQPGDTVALNDVLVEVETAKALVELPSPYGGTVVELLFTAGDTVAVGSPIITIATREDGDDSSAPAEPAGPIGLATEHQPRQPVLVGYGPGHTPSARRPRKTAAPPTFGPSRTDRHVATPLVRKLAQELGVDLSQLTPSGPSGRVTRDDVHRSVNNQQAPSAALRQQAGHGGRQIVTDSGARLAGQVVRTPIRGVRKHTAEATSASAFTAPHVTEWVSVDVTKTLKLLRSARADPQFDDVRLTPLCLVVNAALVAIARHPQINAKWDAASGEIVQYPDVNLGIATATPRGLIVPNIPAAQQLSVREIAVALAELIEEARAGKTPPNRMRDGTFTITNIGVFGVDGGTPILNFGEAAILCFGQIRRQPWEHRGRIRLRDVTTLAMSFDHRLVDGELGSKVLRGIARYLEQPELMVLG